MSARTSNTGTGKQDPRTPDTTADRVQKPAVAPAPGRTRDDAGDPATYGFRSLSDAPEVEDNGPGALEPQRVESMAGLDENGNSTFASRRAARQGKGTPGGAENKAVNGGLMRSQPDGGTTGNTTR